MNKQSSGKLILVRHTESEWNKLGKWAGKSDVKLSDKGRKDAHELGKILRDIDLHHMYTSTQIRAIETLSHVLESAGKNSDSIPHEKSGNLNERDYGEYTGLNKWEVLEQVGEEEFTKIRRGWEHPIPGGETLKMVHERVVPFYKDYILPKLLAGNNVLLVSSNNSLRALIKYLEDISDEGIAEVDTKFGRIFMYHVDLEGRRTNKEMHQIDTEQTRA